MAKTLVAPNEETVSMINQVQTTRERWRSRAALVAVVMIAGALAPALRAETHWQFAPVATPERATPALPPIGQFPVQLVLDDDTAEGAVGVAGAAARQFLWFNRFTPGTPFNLEEVWVLFTPGPNMATGNAIELAVYADADGNPANGATLLASFSETIQAVDGNTFSVYSLPAPVAFDGVGDLLIGVVPRFIVSGVTGPTQPAAIDTTASQGRSWLGVWTTDPPSPPVLNPPPNQQISTVDGFLPGDWMIRGFGTLPQALAIPTLGGPALVGLALLLGLAATFVLRKRARGLAMLLAALLGLGLAGSAAAQTTIDTFTTNQTTLSAPPTSSSSVTGGADIIGTRRGLVAVNASGAGPTTTGVAAGALTLTVTNTTPDSRGEARLSWDGDTNPTVLTPAGLGGVNLTTANASGFRVRINSATAGTELDFKVYSSASNHSRAVRVLPAIGVATNVFIPFSEFRVTGGTGASFTSVGAIELTIRGTEVTVAIDEIVAGTPSIAAAKNDTLTIDNDADTRTDPGDRLRYTVTITNTGSEALSVDLTDTVDANTTLVGGSVRTTPIARNDQYAALTGVPLDSAAAGLPSLIANDSDPDGNSISVVATVSQATTKGGTVNVNTNGSFVYNTPPTFFGADSFSYTLQTVAGDPTVNATGGAIAASQAVAYVAIDPIPPTLTAGATLTYTENDPATVIDNTVTVIDPDSATLASATVQITGNYINGQDVLSYSTVMGITGVFTPASGTMTLTGPASPASFQAALRTVRYANTSDNPSTLARTVTWIADDGIGSSSPVTSTINIIAVNDPPVVTAGATLNYTENDPPSVIDNTITVTDPDNTTLPSATAQITGNYVNGQDVLSYSTIMGITGVFAPASGTMTLTGPASPASFQAAMRTVRYSNTSENPSTLVRTVTWLTTDGSLASSPVTSTINVIPVNDPPVADNDAFDFIGNTELRVDSGTVTTPHVLATTPSTFGVLDGDSDPAEGNAIAVSAITVGACTDNSAPFDCTDAGVGTVHMQTNGRFTFEPAPGDTGATETFQYTVTDNGTPLPASTVATVTLTRSNRVWYVDPTAGGGGNGTSVAPFNALTSLNGAGGAGDVDLTGDYIFIHDGTLAGTIELEANQHLIGQGVALSIPVGLNGNASPTVLAAATTQPLLTNASGDTVIVTAAMPVEIRGLSLASTTSNAVDVTTTTALSGSASLTIADNTIRGAGAEGIDVNLNAGTTGTLALAINTNAWNTAGTHTGNGVDVNRTAGTLQLAFSNNTNILSAANAVNINGGAIASTTITAFANNTVHMNTGGNGFAISNVTFDATAGGVYDQVSGGATVAGASGNGVGASAMVLTNVAGDLAFTDLDLFADNGAALSVTGTGALNVAGGTGTRVAVSSGVASLVAIGGPAANLSGLTTDLQPTFLSSTNTTSTGISLTNVSDATSPTFDAVFIAPGGSSITTTAAASGPAFAVSGGNARINYPGTITNNSTSARAVSISTWSGDDASDDLILSGAIDENGAGILLNGNGGSRAITFSGGMDIDTTTGEGFAATSNTNTLGVNVTGTNTIDSVSATALRVTSTTIGSSNLTFQHISSGNNTAAADPANGIVLSTTGTSGRLIVSGTGSAGSGGTIQHAGTGISLTSTQNPSFSWMQLNDFTDFGIRGSSVVGFTLANSVINGTNGDNAGADEGSVRFTELTGSASITSCNISGAVENNFTIVNTGGTLNRVTFSSVTFGANNTATGDDALLIEGQNASVVNVTVQNGTFTSARGDHFQLNLTDTASADLVFTGNTISNAHPAVVSGGGGIRLTGGSAGGNVTATYNISNNTIRDSNGTAIGVTKGAGSGTFTGTIDGNQVGVAAVANSGSAAGSGISVITAEIGSSTTTVSNNQVRQYNNFGIIVQAGGTGTAGSGTLKATVTGNTVSNPGTAIFAKNGFQLNSGTLAGETYSVCLTFGGAGALRNSLVGSGTDGGTDFRLRQRQSTTVRLPGYGGANNDDAAVITFAQGNNNIGGTPTGSATNTVPTGGGWIGGVCP